MAGPLIPIFVPIVAFPDLSGLNSNVGKPKAAKQQELAGAPGSPKFGIAVLLRCPFSARIDIQFFTPGVAWGYDELALPGLQEERHLNLRQVVAIIRLYAPHEMSDLAA